MLGYLDETGTPGAAINSNDYYSLCLTIVKNQEKYRFINSKIDNFRASKKIPRYYEFHYSHNSTQMRRDFTDVITTLPFNFIFIYSKKNAKKSKTTCSDLATKLVEVIIDFFPDIKVLMDKNQALYRALNAQIKEDKKKNEENDIRLKQANSKSDNPSPVDRLRCCNICKKSKKYL